MTAASLQDWTPGPDREARRRTADYARRRYQLTRAGQWAPFTDTGPVREHLQVLREAGVTLEQIGGVAGVSVATLSRAAKEPRMTSAAADAIMAITVPAAHPHERPGAAVAEKLRTLVADGWTLVQIAEATGLSDRASNGRCTNRSRRCAARSRPSTGRTTSSSSRTPATDTSPLELGLEPSVPGGNPVPHRRRQKPTSTTSPSSASSPATDSRSGQPSSRSS